MKIILSESQLNIIQKALKENEELEVNADDVNLSSFKPKDRLTSKLWDGTHLNSQIRLHLLDIADEFFNSLLLNTDIIDVRLTGSCCNYNWSEFSDIDLHILIDFSTIDVDDDFIRDYLKTKTREWNNAHDTLSIHGMTVEVYVEDINDTTVSKGIYSLNKDKWVSIPKSIDIDITSMEITEDLREAAAELMTMIDDLKVRMEENKDNIVILRDILNCVNFLIKQVHALREQGLESEGGEMSPQNISYKILRREGYLDLLYNMGDELYDIVNSIE